MTDEGPFPIEEAPRDGSTILVFHGAQQVSARAYWNVAMQGWVDISRGCAEPKVLHMVSWWEPL